MSTREAKIVFFMFAGREENMTVARPHLERLLQMYPNSVLHLWDLTRQRSDAYYIMEWSRFTERVVYQGGLHPGHPITCRGERRRGHPPCVCIRHKPPYEQVWQWYERFTPFDQVADYYVKIDDDVVWMDTQRFDEVLSFLETADPLAVASANVANNAVCAKYDLVLNEMLGVSGGLDTEWDQFWWSLHTSPALATLSHEQMIRDIGRSQAGRGLVANRVNDAPFRTREGEAVSINFVAVKFPALCVAAQRMHGDGGSQIRLGDEGAIDSLLPWIIPNFRVAHLTFGPQEKYLPATWFAETLAAYAALTPKEKHDA